MAETDPEYQVELEYAGAGGISGQTNRLVDDVFSRTCQAINDVRETVRVLAATLIGINKHYNKIQKIATFSVECETSINL